MIERTIRAATHGRYLVAPPEGSGPWPLLVGFHGYAEAAEIALERLVAVDPDGAWLRVAVQGLNRFYRRRSNEVIAGWMTRQDRELAIADNLAYVQVVVDAVAREWPVSAPLVYSGFSQGVAMAFRAAVASAGRVAAVLAVAGDIPPEIDQGQLARIPRVLVARGSADPWYTAAKVEADERRLEQAGVACARCRFTGGHEWAAAVTDEATQFLRRVRS